jgi:O-antigen ligase
LVIALAILPLGFMTFKGLFGYLSAVCLILSILALFINSNDQVNFFKNKYGLLILVSLSATTVSILITQTLRGDFSAAAYDGPIRLLFALPILLAIYKHKIDFTKLLSYMIPLALLAIFVYAKLNTHIYGNRLTNPYMDPILWGNFSILLGFLSFASIQADDHLAIKIYKLLGFGLGGYMSLLSGSRSGWLAFIVIAFLWLILNRKRLSLKQILLFGLTCLLGLVLLYIFSDSFSNRINAAILEINGWVNKTQIESSSGYRLTMWKMTLYLFSQSPWIGYGEYALLPIVNDPYILSFADPESIFTIQCCGPHNEVAAHSLKLGVLGIFSLLAKYFIPTYIFNQSKDFQSKIMGISLCVGIFVCGFTTEMLGLKVTYTFYAIIMSGMLATALWKSKP